MSAHNTGDSSRKPSGSSTHSGGHSPTNTPGNTGRKLNPGSTGMFGVGMGGVKNLNSGWQVWGSGTPTSKRNASVSSATSATDLSPSQADTGFRGNLGETWTSSRPPSGTWDDATASPQKKDYPQLDSQPPTHLQNARQRQAAAAQAAFSGPRMDERAAGPKTGQFSPQRFDNSHSKDSGASRYASTSPTKPYGAAAYTAPPSGIQNYDSLQSSTSVDNDLSLALRGMAVEDDFASSQSNRPTGTTIPGTTSGNNQRAPPVNRGPYPGYPPADYAAYYPPGRESYMDYQYPYDAYRGNPEHYTASGMSGASQPNLYPGVSQSLHPSAMADIHRQQPGMFYDYSGGARPPGSQFYYPPHQAMMYPPTHSPMITPQLPASTAATLGDKKRELQYNIQQQIAPQNMMYTGLRSTPSPHPQAYGGMEYNSSMMMHAGPMYNPNAQNVHMYQQNARGGNRRTDGNETAPALRSPLLDDFRANKARKWELRDIFGHVVEFSGDQHGSRFIQQKLESTTSEEKQIVFDEIVPDNTLQLIQDVFGNYVIQKLFEHGTQVQKTVLANTMEGHILALSLQMYGCRVVQKAIEYILPDQQAGFVRELDSHVLKCVKDANGNHVIQKLIERVAPERLGFVNSFRGNVFDLATHPYGCRVLQRCLEHLPEDHTRPLLEELHKYTINLMQDQFGNYVIQFILEHGKPQDKTLVISKLRGQMLQMARHKFASNVCEKALVCADAESRRILIEEIMTPKHDGVSPIVTMMKDQFANYVLQRALAVVDGEQKEALISKVRPQLVSMRRYSSAYSKHLISIERLLEKYPATSPQ